MNLKIVVRQCQKIFVLVLQLMVDFVQQELKTANAESLSAQAVVKSIIFILVTAPAGNLDLEVEAQANPVAKTWFPR
jgi:hypothetical protein